MTANLTASGALFVATAAVRGAKRHRADAEFYARHGHLSQASTASSAAVQEAVRAVTTNANITIFAAETFNETGEHIQDIDLIQRISAASSDAIAEGKSANQAVRELQKRIDAQ